jgi:hypothetical protein
MADPTTQASIRDASLAACAQLPAGIMQETCTTFVEQYGAWGHGGLGVVVSRVLRAGPLPSCCSCCSSYM